MMRRSSSARSRIPILCGTIHDGSGRKGLLGRGLLGRAGGAQGTGDIVEWEQEKERHRDRDRDRAKARAGSGQEMDGRREADRGLSRARLAN